MICLNWGSLGNSWYIVMVEPARCRVLKVYNYESTKITKVKEKVKATYLGCQNVWCIIMYFKYIIFILLCITIFYFYSLYYDLLIIIIMYYFLMLLITEIYSVLLSRLSRDRDDGWEYMPMSVARLCNQQHYFVLNMKCSL